MLCMLPCPVTNTTTRCLVRRLVANQNHHRSSLVVVLADDRQCECSTKRKTRGILVGERQNFHSSSSSSSSSSHNNNNNNKGYCGGVVDYYASTHSTRSRHFNNSQQQQQQQQHQQMRWLATHGGGKSNKGYYKHSLGRGKKEQECPFVVLGLSATPLINTLNNGDDGGGDRGISYTTVKKTFLKIAMARHPDTSTSKTKDEQEQDKEIFLASLHAFEKIASGPNGVAVLRSELEGYQDDDENNANDLNAWFKQETGGFDMPFMDARTIKEVAEMTATIGGGLDRDGGMWTLARMVTESAKSGNGDGMSILQLEAGSVRDKKINGILRRKRNR